MRCSTYCHVRARRRRLSIDDRCPGNLLSCSTVSVRVQTPKSSWLKPSQLEMQKNPKLQLRLAFVAKYTAKKPKRCLRWPGHTAKKTFVSALTDEITDWNYCQVQTSLAMLSRTCRSPWNLSHPPNSSMIIIYFVSERLVYGAVGRDAPILFRKFQKSRQHTDRKDRGKGMHHLLLKKPPANTP